ncbi:MAG: nucleotide exchange factor GrpE [Pseudomonadota bacterium]|nr:nucleotide exchange factor GrpE [Pseudomonadota bacterium]
MSQTRDEAQHNDGGTEVEEERPEGASLVEDEVGRLAAKVLELEARLRTVSAAYRQKQEEIESTKRRLEDRASMQEEIRRGEVVASLFDPVENLHRSLEASKGLPAEQGLRMVYQQFMGALQKLGLEEVPGAGAPFDPSLHEAIATMPVDDAEQDNVVQSVFSAGYRIGKRLIRPARVVIGSYTPPVAEA